MSEQAKGSSKQGRFSRKHFKEEKKEQKREWKKRRREEKKRQRKRAREDKTRAVISEMADQSVLENETPDKEAAEIEAEEGMPCAMEKTRIEMQSHEKTVEQREEQLKCDRKQSPADEEIEERVILSNEKKTDSSLGV